jgi:hypothetical protein
MRRYAAAPILDCLIQEGLFERGQGTVILSRRPAVGRWLPRRSSSTPIASA